VASRRKTLRNTFVREFVSVPEMAALYRHWQEKLGAAIHYVSASPWHLYPFLEEFLAGQGFPKGTLYLRHFRLMPSDLRQTLRSGRHVKLKHARDLLRRFPRRKFYLVGDSGESDPAIYAQLYREFPGQVERILIRDMDDSDRHSRALRALGDVPSTRHELFKDVSTIKDG
jgi:phosphatidate phosphatase APP1